MEKSQALESLEKNTKYCPKCESIDVDKVHHDATFALPECWHWFCNNCEYDWDYQ